MDIMQAIQIRHSVRQYADTPIETEKVGALRNIIDECNKAGKLHMQLALDEPKAFGSVKARYGNFSGISNYIALVGRFDDTFEERMGYYGERVLLEAVMLGLNTCWAVLSFREVPEAFTLDGDEDIIGAIVIGHGLTAGEAHLSKPMDRLCKVDGDMPEWFRQGMESAMLAPTAMNQQKFTFTLAGDNKVKATTAQAFFGNVDLGIAKLHFELGAGKDNFTFV